MKLTSSEKKVIIDKLHNEGWKDKDIVKHIENLENNLRKVSKEVRRRELEEESFKKTDDYFKQEVKRLNSNLER